MKPRDLIFNKAYLTVVGCKIVVSIYSLFFAALLGFCHFMLKSP